MEKQRLFVDMDGTLSVFQPVDTMEALYEKGFFLNSLPQPNVVRAVKSIIRNHQEIEVYTLSATLTDSKFALAEKHAWLNQYLPEIPPERRLFPPCGTDKRDCIAGGLRATDFLLDDYTRNLQLWQQSARGIKLLNGINHTNGTWQHDRIRHDKPSAELAGNIVSIMRGEQRIMDDNPPRIRPGTVCLDTETLSIRLDQVFSSLSQYDRYLRFCDLAAASLLSADNLALTLAACPQATEAGTLGYWNRRNRSIVPQAKAIPVMLEQGRHLSTGYVFDLSQTQPSAAALVQNQQPYRRRYPFNAEKLDAFYVLWQQAIREVRIMHKPDIGGRSELQGAAIYIRPDLPAGEQAQEALYQYFRHGWEKAAGSQQQQAGTEAEIAGSAATAAYILGQKLGFSMAKPDQIAKPSGIFSCRFDDMRAALNRIVSSATRTYETLGRTANRLFEQQRELGRQM